MNRTFYIKEAVFELVQTRKSRVLQNQVRVAINSSYARVTTQHQICKQNMQHIYKKTFDNEKLHGAVVEHYFFPSSFISLRILLSYEETFKVTMTKYS